MRTKPASCASGGHQQRQACVLQRVHGSHQERGFRWKRRVGGKDGEPSLLVKMTLMQLWVLHQPHQYLFTLEIFSCFLHSLKPFLSVSLQTLDQNPIYTEEELRDYEQHLANEESDISKKSVELQKQREELERQQEELNNQKLGLKQVKKFKTFESTWLKVKDPLRSSFDLL